MRGAIFPTAACLAELSMSGVVARIYVILHKEPV